MKIRNYKNYLYVISYLMLLKVVLSITVGISVFGMGTLFDLVMMMFWVGTFAYFLKSPNVQKVYYIFIILVWTVLVVGDSVYFDYFDVISSRSSLSGLKWLQEGKTLEYDISIPLVAYLISPLLIGVIYLIVKNKKSDVFVLKDFSIVSVVFFVQVALFLFWGNQDFNQKIDYYRSDAFLFETMHDRSLYCKKYGYYNYHLLDLTRIRPTADEDELYEEVDAFFNTLDDHETNDYSDIYAGYNVITILGETLETRFIDPILTPNLYLMQSEGYSFDNYYTTVFQQGATCNSEYMSITGLGAINTNDWSSNICDSYSENTFTYSLPNQLEEIGYDTYYFHSGYEWFYNRKVMIPNYGFNTVKFQEDLIGNGYPDFRNRFDTEMMNFFDEYVSYENPVYINLLTYSMHGAYNQEEFEVHSSRVNSAYPDVELESEIRNYMLKLVEFDNMLGLVIEELRDNDELDNTLFAIFPDHYPYMMNYDIYTEYIDVEDDFHEVMRQDLILYTTDMTAQVIHTPGSTIDIAPTLLNLVYSDADFNYFIGNDLLSGEDNFIIFSDLTISDGINILYLDETYFGDSSQLAILETALEEGITALEIQKKLLNGDYFKKKENNN